MNINKSTNNTASTKPESDGAMQAGKVRALTLANDAKQWLNDMTPFFSDPIQAAKSKVICSKKIPPNNQPLNRIGSFRLEKTPANGWQVQASNEKSWGLPAFFLGYDSVKVQENKPKYIDIPIHPDTNQPKFMFTGELGGCSVIVTRLDNDTFRVFHDSRVNASLYYDHVVMATDFTRYGEDAKPQASTFMAYEKGRWNLITQKQDLESSGEGVFSAFRDNQPNATLYTEETFPRNYKEQLIDQIVEKFQLPSEVKSGKGDIKAALKDLIHPQKTVSADVLTRFKPQKMYGNYADMYKVMEELYHKQEGDVVVKGNTTTRELSNKPDKLIWQTPPETMTPPLVNPNSSQFDKQVVVQLQGDETSFESAKQLVEKNLSNTEWVQLRPARTTVSKWENGKRELTEGFSHIGSDGKVRITFVGHGNTENGMATFGGKGVDTLKQFLKDTLNTLPQDVKGIRLKLVGCELIKPSQAMEKTIPGELAKTLVDFAKDKGIQDVSATATQHRTRVVEGKKQCFIHGQWLTKEQAALDNYKQELITPKGEVIQSVSSLPNGTERAYDGFIELGRGKRLFYRHTSEHGRHNLLLEDTQANSTKMLETGFDFSSMIATTTPTGETMLHFIDKDGHLNRTTLTKNNELSDIKIRQSMVDGEAVTFSALKNHPTESGTFTALGSDGYVYFWHQRDGVEVRTRTDKPLFDNRQAKDAATGDYQVESNGTVRAVLNERGDRLSTNKVVQAGLSADDAMALTQGRLKLGNGFEAVIQDGRLLFKSGLSASWESAGFSDVSSLCQDAQGHVLAVRNGREIIQLDNRGHVTVTDVYDKPVASVAQLGQNRIVLHQDGTLQFDLEPAHGPEGVRLKQLSYDSNSKRIIGLSHDGQVYTAQRSDNTLTWNDSPVAEGVAQLQTLPGRRTALVHADATFRQLTSQGEVSEKTSFSNVTNTSPLGQLISEQVLTHMGGNFGLNKGRLVFKDAVDTWRQTGTEGVTRLRLGADGQAYAVIGERLIYRLDSDGQLADLVFEAKSGERIRDIAINDQSEVHMLQADKFYRINQNGEKLYSELGSENGSSIREIAFDKNGALFALDKSFSVRQFNPKDFTKVNADSEGGQYRTIKTHQNGQIEGAFVSGNDTLEAKWFKVDGATLTPLNPKVEKAKGMAKDVAKAIKDMLVPGIGDLAFASKGAVKNVWHGAENKLGVGKLQNEKYLTGQLLSEFKHAKRSVKDYTPAGESSNQKLNEAKSPLEKENARLLGELSDLLRPNSTSHSNETLKPIRRGENGQWTLRENLLSTLNKVKLLDDASQQILGKMLSEGKSATFEGKGGTLLGRVFSNLESIKQLDQAAGNGSLSQNKQTILDKNSQALSNQLEQAGFASLGSLYDVQQAVKALSHDLVRFDGHSRFANYINKLAKTDNATEGLNKIIDGMTANSRFGFMRKNGTVAGYVNGILGTAWDSQVAGLGGCAGGGFETQKGIGVEFKFLGKDKYEVTWTSERSHQVSAEASLGFAFKNAHNKAAAHVAIDPALRQIKTHSMTVTYTKAELKEMVSQLTQGKLKLSEVLKKGSGVRVNQSKDIAGSLHLELFVGLKHTDEETFGSEADSNHFIGGIAEANGEASRGSGVTRGEGTVTREMTRSRQANAGAKAVGISEAWTSSEWFDKKVIDLQQVDKFSIEMSPPDAEGKRTIKSITWEGESNHVRLQRDPDIQALMNNNEASKQKLNELKDLEGSTQLKTVKRYEFSQKVIQQINEGTVPLKSGQLVELARQRGNRTLTGASLLKERSGSSQTGAAFIFGGKSSAEGSAQDVYWDMNVQPEGNPTFSGEGTKAGTKHDGYKPRETGEPGGLKGGSRLALLPDLITDIKSGAIKPESLKPHQRNALRQYFGSEERAFKLIKTSKGDALMEQALNHQGILERMERLVSDDAVRQSAFSAMEASMALVYDHGLLTKALSDEINAIQHDNPGLNLSKVAPEFDFKSGIVKFVMEDSEGNVTEHKVSVDPEKLKSRALLDDYKSRLAGGSHGSEVVGKINQAMGIYGSVMGFVGSVNALKNGDVTNGSINMLQTLHGAGELTGINPQIYRASSKALGKALTGDANALAQDTGKILQEAGELGEEARGFIGEDIPFVGSAFAFYNVVQDLERGDTLGDIDAGIDGLIGLGGIVGALFPPGEAVIAPAVMALTMLRMGIDDMYRDIKKDLDALGEKADWDDKVDALMKGAWQGVKDTAKDSIKAWMSLGKVETDYDVQKRNDAIDSFLWKLKDQEYFEQTKQTIDFEHSPNSTLGGGVVFKMGEPGETSTVTIPELRDNRAISNTGTVNLKATKGPKTIILNFGRTETVSVHEEHVRVPHSVPDSSGKHWDDTYDDQNLVFMLKESMKISKDSDTLFGTFFGNSQGNTFVAPLDDPKDKDGRPVDMGLAKYAYRLVGGVGNDTFIVGPQSSHITGVGGANRYVINPKHKGQSDKYRVVKEVTIDNHSSNGQTSTLELNTTQDNIRFVRDGQDLLVRYPSGADISTVRLLGWYHGKDYRRLRFKTTDGYSSVSQETSNQPQLNLLAKLVSQDGVKEKNQDTSVNQFVIGGNKNDIVGNDRNNIFMVTGDQNTINGVQGSNRFNINWDEEKSKHLTIESSKGAGQDTLHLNAKDSDIELGRSSNGNDLEIEIRHKKSQPSVVVVKGYFANLTDKRQPIAIITKDGVQGIVQEDTQTGSVTKINSILDFSQVDWNVPNEVDLNDPMNRHVTLVMAREGQTIVGTSGNNKFRAMGNGVTFISQGGKNDYVFEETSEGQVIVLHENDELSTLFIRGGHLDTLETTFDSNTRVLKLYSKGNAIAELKNYTPERTRLAVKTNDGLFTVDKHGYKQVLSVEGDDIEAEKWKAKTLLGTNKKSVLEGGENNNTLDGGGCADLTQCDTLVGNEGHNTYVVKEGYNFVEIYNASEDKKTDILQLHADFTTLKALRDGDDVIITNDEVMHKSRKGSNKKFFSVKLKDWFKGEDYQHLYVTTKDGVLSKIELDKNNQGTAKLSAFSMDNRNHKKAQHVDLSKPGYETLKGFKGSLSNTNVIKANDLGNHIEGGDENDKLYGGKGNDTFISGHGKNLIDGGGGINTVKFKGKQDNGVTVNLLTGKVTGADGKESQLVNIQRVVGSLNNDTLVSGKGDNVLQSNDGNNTFESVAGSDTLVGGVGKDTFKIYFTLESAKQAGHEGLSQRNFFGKNVIVEAKNKDAKFELLGVKQEQVVTQRVRNSLIISIKDSKTGKLIPGARQLTIKGWFSNLGLENVKLKFDDGSTNVASLLEKTNKSEFDTWTKEKESLKETERLKKLTPDQRKKEMQKIIEEVHAEQKQIKEEQKRIREKKELNDKERLKKEKEKLKAAQEQLEKNKKEEQRIKAEQALNASKDKREKEFKNLEEQTTSLTKGLADLKVKQTENFNKIDAFFDKNNLNKSSKKVFYKGEDIWTEEIGQIYDKYRRMVNDAIIHNPSKYSQEAKNRIIKDFYSKNAMVDKYRELMLEEKNIGIAQKKLDNSQEKLKALGEEKSSELQNFIQKFSKLTDMVKQVSEQVGKYSKEVGGAKDILQNINRVRDFEKASRPKHHPELQKLWDKEVSQLNRIISSKEGYIKEGEQFEENPDYIKFKNFVQTEEASTRQIYKEYFTLNKYRIWSEDVSGKEIDVLSGVEADIQSLDEAKASFEKELGYRNKLNLSTEPLENKIKSIDVMKGFLNLEKSRLNKMKEVDDAVSNFKDNFWHEVGQAFEQLFAPERAREHYTNRLIKARYNKLEEVFSKYLGEVSEFEKKYGSSKLPDVYREFLQNFMQDGNFDKAAAKEIFAFGRGSGKVSAYATINMNDCNPETTNILAEVLGHKAQKESNHEKLAGRDQEGDVANTSRVNNLQLVQAMNSMGSGEKTGLDNKLSQSDKTLIKVKPILSHRY